MKKESSGKKSLLWLWITIAVVVVAAVAVALVFILGGTGNDKNKDRVYSEIYWNVDRETMHDEESGLSLREPAEDGMYYVRFAVGGEQVELPIADGKLANKVDLYDAMCLEFNADGTVVDVIPAKEAYTVIGENVIVQNIEGESYLLNSSIAFNGMETTVNIGEDVGVYNVVKSRPEVPGRLFKTGELGTLEIMDTITIYGTDENTPTDIFVTSRPYASKVYWRAEAGQFDSANKRSTREQAEDGFWYVDFLVDGKIETYRTNNQAVINALDGYGTIACACSLIFDQEGNVVDCASAAYAIRGKVAAATYNVTALSADGKTFTATRLFAGNEAGRTYSGVIGEDTKVYNVNTTADYLGQEDTLQEGDLLYILSDPMGNAKVIFITNRYVDSPMYYNVSQKYDSTTKQTSRTPDASGWYTIELAVKGQLKKFRCSSWEIVNQIDTAPNRCMGLKLSGDVIVKYYDPSCVAGNWSFGSGYFVISADGVILSAESTSGVVANGVMVDGCEIYDVSGHSDFRGQVTTLREGDRIVGYKNPQGEVTHVYVTARYEPGVSLYWNVNRNTSRQPNADGWYVYKMIKMGQTGYVTVKTKDQKIATTIDTYNPAAICLRVNSEGVITKVYISSAFTIGYEHLSGIHVVNYNADTGRWLLKYRSTGAEANVDVSNAVIYNFSGVYDKAPGERTTFRPGDRIETIYDSHGKIAYAWVYEREYDSNAYWLKDPKTIDSKTGYTTREKAADGYYYFTVAVNGGTKTVKTNDIEIATALDSTVKNNLCLAFGLKLDGDVIKAVLSAGSVKGIYMSGQSYYDVTAINGNTITLTRLKPGSSNTGDKQVINISSAKVYEVSQYAGDKFGKETKLTIGDRVQTYLGEDGETISYVFVAFHNTHEAGAYSYCEHCDKEVFWHPYVGTADYIKDYSYHYYLTSDYERPLSTGWGVSGAKTGYDWVLDLNGYTYRATGSYAYAVRGSSTLTILDTSKAKTGAVTGVGVQIKDADGNKSKYQSSVPGIFQVLDNGTLNLRGGTYTRTVDREITSLRRGGVAIVNSTGTLNIYEGAKLVNNTMDVPLDLATDGKTEVRRAPQGGALYNNGGTINIYGGLIADNGKIHEDFAEFANTAVGNGGNIFNASGTLNIYGGKISGGWCVGNGGNIYVNGGKLNIAGGEISNGTSINGSTNNIIVAANKNVEVTIAGGKVTGDFTISTGNTLKVSGKPQVTLGEDLGLLLGDGVKAEVGKLESGAKIVLSSSGVFTTDFASEAAADAVLAMKVFVGASDKTPFYREGKALACGRQMCMNGHTNKAACNAAGCEAEMLSWTAWEETDALPTMGNYYLTDDVKIDARVMMSDNVNLDLNGHNITRVIKAGATDYGVYTTNGKGNLGITDLSGGTVGTVKTVFDTGVTEVNGTGFLCYTGAGFTTSIYNGVFDFRGIKTTNAAATGCGPIIADGNVVINGGTFYGMTAPAGCGALFAGRSTSTLTVNGGTFIGGTATFGGILYSNGKIIVNAGTLVGGSATRGGLIFTTDLEIKGGLFDGNNNGTDGKINADYPASVVGAHAGLIRANGTITISGGTFQNGYAKNAAGILWADGAASNVTITGGTFQNGKSGTTGGLMRFDGTATITGATLKGGTAGTLGSAIAFCSNKTLTIGQDAVIEGGVETRQYTGETDTKIVLKDNVQILGKGVLLVDATLDISGLVKDAKVYINHTEIGVAFAEAADAATAQALVDNESIVSADANYVVIADGNKLTVKEFDGFREWTSEDSLPTSGKYYLSKNVTIDARVDLTGDLYLDLNGHNITRVIKADAVNYGVYNATAGNLHITDLSGGTVGTVKAEFDTDVTTCAGTGFMGYVAAGKTLTIDNGIFDYRDVKTTNAASTGCGPIVADGNVEINGGTFYGTKASSGCGALFAGRSASTLTVNGGTFIGGTATFGGILYSNGKIIVNDGTLIGGSATRGGLIFTKDLEINGGMFDGNNNGADGKVNADYPVSVVGAHAGLIRVNGKADITSGTFQNGYAKNAAGILWADGAASEVTITGGTFQNGKGGTTGGLMRFDGTATITGATLKGGTAGTLGSAIAFCSNKTLTIGQDAVIEGGVETRQYTGETDTKIVLKDNVQILGKGVLLVDTTLDISGLNDEAKVHINHTDATKAFAEAADEATAKALVDNKIIVSGDPNYRVITDGKKLTIKAQIQWQEWNAAAAATALGGAEADNLHLKNLPTAGDWKLTADVTIEARVAMTGNLNLNLNGFTVTRKLTATDSANGIYTTNGKGNLYITDEIKDTDPDAEIGKMTAAFDTGVTTCSGTGFLGYVGAGYSITIDEGVFDFRGVKTTNAATTGTGAIIVDGTLTINGGTFYGVNCGTTGYGTVIGGRSAGVITINAGTFYGNNAKQGGIISTTGNLTINGGLFDGNTNSSNGKVDSTLPQSVATHGGLFYVAKALTITDGEFKAGRVSGSGGIAYVTGSDSVISGGTYTAGGQTNYAGFFRFDGSATISGVTLSGGKATTNGNNIAFGSNGNATLTIGQDAVIDGGIMFRNDKTGNKLVLVGNAQVNGGTGAAYSLNLANATVHIGDAASAAVATVGSTFTNYIATYGADGNVTGVATN